MGRNWYRRGADKERAIVRAAKKEGHIALRSAASRSPIDVVIIRPMSRTITLMQCKTGYFSNSEKQRLEEKYTHLKGVYQVEFIVDSG